MLNSTTRGSPSLQELFPRSRKRFRQDKTITSRSRKRRKSISASESESEPDQFSDAPNRSKVEDAEEDVGSEESPADNEAAPGQEKQQIPLLARKQEETQTGQQVMQDTADETKPSKSTHVRFGSEEPPEPALEEAQHTELPQIDNGSDDEAPEAVSTFAAQQKIKELASGAAKAIKSERVERKRKHSKHEALLRRQAEASAKRKKERQANTEQINAKSALPDLLPDEILNSAPFERPPTPEAENRPPIQAFASSKRKVKLDIAPRPKDRQVGKFKIRVLESLSGSLAPKPNLSSKAMREAMLTGRRSKRGPTYERKKMNGGFLSG